MSQVVPAGRVGIWLLRWAINQSTFVVLANASTSSCLRIRLCMAIFPLDSGCTVTVMARRLRLLEEWHFWCHLPEAAMGQGMILRLRGRRVGGVCSARDPRVPSPCAHTGGSSVCSCWRGSPAPWIRAGSCRRWGKRPDGVEKYRALPAVCWVLRGCCHGGAGGFLLPRVTTSDPAPWVCQSRCWRLQGGEAAHRGSCPPPKSGHQAKACARDSVELRCLPLSPRFSRGGRFPSLPSMPRQPLM